MPIHCCAMQGRTDAIKILLKYGDEEIRQSLKEEDSTSPPSLINLAIASDHLDCAKWFVHLLKACAHFSACLEFLTITLAHCLNVPFEFSQKD